MGEDVALAFCKGGAAGEVPASREHTQAPPPQCPFTIVLGGEFPYPYSNLSNLEHLDGCGSKLTRRGYAGFGPCFHLPGFHFGTGF